MRASVASTGGAGLSSWYARRMPTSIMIADRQQEGLLTVVVASASYFFIRNYPSTAQFLTEEERDAVQTRRNADSDATQNEAFTWANFRMTFSDIKVYLYALGFHTMSLPLYTLSLFLPSIIKDLGHTSAQAQLLTTPPYAIAFIITMTLY